MTAHTPGPWSIGRTLEENHDRHRTPVHVGDSPNPGNALAFVYLGGNGATLSNRASVEANARLIAAAPDLLEALRMMVRAHNELLPGISHIACQDYQVVNEAPCAAAAAIAKATGEDA